MFQFHKGSINTSPSAQLARLRAAFQFHKGSINTHLDTFFVPYRLLFQFHKGSINTLQRRGGASPTPVSIP